MPLGGDELDRGYLDWYSRKLRWDDALGYPPCMRVKDVAEILVSDL